MIMPDPALRWRIYYGDRRPYDSTTGTPDQAPTRNVQAIAQRDDTVGRIIIAREDYYWFEPDDETWFGGDRFGLFDYLCRPGWKTVLFGRTLTNDEFDRVYQRAVTDPHFPTKSAIRPGEIRPGDWDHFEPPEFESESESDEPED